MLELNRVSLNVYVVLGDMNAFGLCTAFPKLNILLRFLRPCGGLVDEPRCQGVSKRNPKPAALLFSANAWPGFYPSRFKDKHETKIFPENRNLVVDLPHNGPLLPGVLKRLLLEFSIGKEDRSQGRFPLEKSPRLSSAAPASWWFLF